MVRTFLITFIAATALAQDAAPPRFLVERIEVRNAQRVSADLVVSETLLREGVEYSEEDLRAAASRLSRLPFLVSADFALEKGSERGRHVLVITVNETKPFFFLIDAVPIIQDDLGPTRVENADDVGAEPKDGAFGFRWFVGRRGIVHLGYMTRNARHAFISDYSAVAIGYTQYDLFNTRAFATINLRLPFGGLAETISPQLVVGMPLTASQTLTLNYEDTYIRNDTQTILGKEIEERDAERLISLSWTYNTTNHPFAPTRGTIVRVSPLRAMRDRSSFRFFQPVPSGLPEPTASHVDGYAIDVTASHFWEISDREAVSAGILTGWATVDDFFNTPHDELDRNVRWQPAYQTLRGSYSRSFWRGDSKAGDSRIEFEGRLVARQFNFKPRIGFGQDEQNQLQGAVSWVRRSSWGMLRLGLGYGWEY